MLTVKLSGLFPERSWYRPCRGWQWKVEARTDQVQSPLNLRAHIKVTSCPRKDAGETEFCGIEEPGWEQRQRHHTPRERHR